MKVILRADVEKLGKLGDLVEVRPGYGRNYLLPQGYAMQATPANLKVFELERKKLQAKTEALRGAAASLAAQIEKAVVSIAMRVGENDKLYGSVTSGMIAEALAAQNIEVDRRRILLDTPIRMLGEHPIRVRLHADVVAQFTLSIVAERAVHADEQEVADAANEQPIEEQTAE